MYEEDVQELDGITMSKISSGDGGMTVLGKEDSVGDGVQEEKFSCSSSLMHLPLLGNSLLYTW